MLLTILKMGNIVSGMNLYYNNVYIRKIGAKLNNFHDTSINYP